MHYRMSHLIRLLAVLTLLVGLLPAQALFAQDDKAAGEVVATGLNGPMGVLVDPNGDIWVIDSGLGGEETIQAVDPEADGPVEATYGMTSRIVKISAADGTATDVATVASVAVPSGVSGGSRLALLDGKLYATVGDWASTPDIDPPAGVAVVAEIGEDGTVTQLTDSWAFERDSNPYGVVYHAHPYGILGGPDGYLWVADAGGNNLQRIDPATGEIEVVAIFEPLPGVFPRPDYDNQMLTDPVPTGVAIGADGGVYVSLLSGFPFGPGSAKVMKVAEDGSISDYATGLTMLTDLRAGPDGELYAVTFAVNGQQGPIPNSGAVIRVKEGDASEIVIPGLTFPTSVDFNADGDAFVTVNGVGAPGSGEVVKFAGATAMTGTPVDEVMAALMAMMPPAEGAPAEGAPAEGGEATPVATEEATAEATPEATEEATAEATPAATEEATAEATAEATPEATEEPTAEATPEATPEATAEAAPATPAVAREIAGSLSAKPDIVDTAAAAGNFTTLLSAAEVAGLVDALKGEGPLTLFAPTDAAFDAVPPEILDALVADPAALQKVLLYHVIDGRLPAALISDGKEVVTLEGSTVLFSFVDGVKKVNDAVISGRGVQASNGIIHVIDSVLLPPDLAIAGAPAAEAATPEATPAATEEAAAEATAEATPEATEEAMMGSEAVKVGDQESDGASVMVDSVTAEADGWMVIHADADGAPGAVLGQTAVPAGMTENVVVLLDPVLEGDAGLWAMLHVDAGELGTYEFPGPDVPVMDGDAIVMTPFKAMVATAEAAAEATPAATEEAAAEATPAATEEAAAEATPAATEEAAAEATPAATEEAAAEATPAATEEAAAEATPAATEEAAAEATPAATEEAAAEATPAATEEAAPETLPATGADSNNLLLIVVAGFVLAIAAGAVFVSRRRMA